MEAQLRLLSAPKVERAPKTTAAGDTRTRRVPPGSPSSETDPAPALESGPTAWRLSASTRAVGRDGIESARAAIRRARAGDDAGATRDERGRSAA